MTEARRAKRASLQRRVILLVSLGMLVILGVLGVSSFLVVRESIRRSLEERLALAYATADHLEYVLRQNLSRLGDVASARGVDMEDADLTPEREALHSLYLSSLFDDRVYLLDSQGSVLWAEPYRSDLIGANLASYPHIRDALGEGKALVSNVYTIEPAGRAVVSAAFPLKSQGKLVGLVAGDIDLTGPSLREVIQPVRLGKTGYIEVVDSRGVVLTGTKPGEVLKTSDHGNILADLIKGKKATSGTCHSCHEGGSQRTTEVMAFAPLTTVPWGVTIRQSEAEALAPARSLQWRFMGFGLFLFGVAVLLAWGMARSIVKPIGVLTTAAERIAAGNLSDPIPSLGKDEIGRLGQSFDAMRKRLKESLERIQEWNKELESTVQKRTRELEGLYSELQKKEIARGELLRKVITVQEEERKRVARELHDDTSQALAALVLAMDTYAAATDPRELKTKLEGMKSLALGALEGVHRRIFDLRPSVLDDLGLLPALRWLAESRLESQGVKVSLEIEGRERRLPSEMETALFRILQEAITNVVKHAEAENVVISVEFKDSTLHVEVEDDGKGFNVEVITESPPQTRGLGLLGMKERVSLLEGLSVPQAWQRRCLSGQLPDSG